MTCVRLFKRTIDIVENDYGGYLMNMSYALGDVDGDGHLDVIVSGRKGRMVWLENRGPDHPWIEHLIDDGDNMELDKLSHGAERWHVHVWYSSKED